MKILVVEDDECQLECLEAKLAAQGHEVRVAPDGDIALARWNKHYPFDLVITDFQCGGKAIPDGLALIRAIRLLDPDQHFIMQTGERNLLVPLGVKLIHKPYPIHRRLRLMKVPVEPLLPFNPAESR